MVTSPPAVYKNLVIVGGARITETSVTGPSGMCEHLMLALES